MKKWKIRTQFDNDCNEFRNNPGNGMAIPQYEPVYFPDSKRILKLIPKLDEKGKRVYKNLYAEIQAARPATELGNLLRSNPELLTYEPNWKESDVSEKDISILGMDDLMNAEIRAKAALERVKALKAAAAGKKALTDAEKAKKYDEMIKQQAEKSKNNEK